MKRPNLAERLYSTDRAVSPVIGVILMVAITVILAAVIGTFVLDLGQSAGNSAPSASLTVTADTANNGFNVSHKGGDALNAQNTKVIITNETGTGETTFNGTSSPATFSVGDRVDFAVVGGNVTSTTWDSMSDGPGASSFTGMSSGNEYTVQFIDLESQRVIYETTITA